MTLRAAVAAKAERRATQSAWMEFMAESPLNAALRQFEAVEANLDKAERLLDVLMAAIPEGISFGTTTEYDQALRDFSDLIAALPKLDGWKPDLEVMDLDQIAHTRMEAREYDDIDYTISVEQRIQAPPREFGEYKHRFNKMRRALVRDAISGLVDRSEQTVRRLALLVDSGPSDEPVRNFVCEAFNMTLRSMYAKQDEDEKCGYRCEDGGTAVHPEGTA